MSYHVMFISPSSSPPLAVQFPSQSTDDPVDEKHGDDHDAQPINISQWMERDYKQGEHEGESEDEEVRYFQVTCCCFSPCHVMSYHVVSHAVCVTSYHIISYRIKITILMAI